MIKREPDLSRLIIGGLLRSHRVSPQTPSAGPRHWRAVCSFGAGVEIESGARVSRLRRERGSGHRSRIERGRSLGGRRGAGCGTLGAGAAGSLGIQAAGRRAAGRQTGPGADPFALAAAARHAPDRLVTWRLSRAEARRLVDRRGDRGAGRLRSTRDRGRRGHARRSCQAHPAEPREARFTNRAWAGLRPVSADGVLLISACRTVGALVAAGHGRNGILPSPLTAERARDAVLGKRVGADDPCRVDRVFDVPRR